MINLPAKTSRILAGFFLAVVFFACCGFGLLRGGSAIPINNTVLLPLTGNFLVTANSGTLTFANSQTRIGWDMMSNGTRTNEQAIGACNGKVLNPNTVSAALTCVSASSSGTNAYQRKRTLQPSPWPSTTCYADSITAVSTLNAPTGSVANHDGTWTWGTGGPTYYQVLLNGTLVSGSINTASQLILGSDDGIYILNGNGHGGWYAWLSATSVFVSWATSAPTFPNVGLFRKAANCPAGL